jgi:hypothetical protein
MTDAVAAHVEDVAVVGQGQALTGFLLDHQDRDALGVDRLDLGEDLVDDAWSKAGRRLVEDEHARSGDQGAGDTEHLTLPAGKRGGALCQGRLEGREGLHDVVEMVGEAAASNAGADLEVLAHGKLREDIGLLRHHVETKAGDGMRRQADQASWRATVIAHDHLTAASTQEPIDRFQERRFSGAIGADHGDDGALGNDERDAVQDILITVAGDEVTYREDRLAPVHVEALTPQPWPPPEPPPG